MINLLSVVDIIRSLTDLVTKYYPQYKIIDYDISEGFEKPCFFIDVEDVQTSWEASDYLKESSNIKIVFFAENRYEGFLDLLDMKNNLTILFNDPLLVSDGKTEYYVSLLNTNSELFKSDKVLTFDITADLIQKVERVENNPNMEELSVNITR